MKKLCQIRRDLKGYCIPFAEDNGGVSDFKRKYQYKWTDDNEGFYIKYRNTWRKAYSIDFNFIN